MAHSKYRRRGAMMLKHLPFLLLFEISRAADTIVNVTLLHLGEMGNSLPNEVVQLAADYINEETGFYTNVELHNIYFDEKSYVKAVCRELQRTTSDYPDIILDTTQSIKYNLKAHKIMVNFGVPSISITESHANTKKMTADEVKFMRAVDEEKYLMKVMPPADIFAQLIMTIVLSQKMKYVAVIYTKEFEYCNKIEKELDEHNIHHMVTLHTSKLMYILLDIMRFKNFILVGNIQPFEYSFGSEHRVYSIVWQESEVNKTAEIVYAYPASPDKQKYDIRIHGGYVQVNAAFYFDLTLSAILTARKIYTEKMSKYEGGQCYSLDVNPRRDTFDVRTYLAKVPIPIYGEIMMARNNETFMQFDVNLVKNNNILATWKSGFNSSLVLKDKATWDGFKEAKAHYKVLARIKPPFVYYDETKDKVFGYSVDLLDMIARVLDFTYEITAINCNTSDFDMDYAGDVPVGYLGEFLESNMDIGLGPVLDSALHYPFVQFSLPYYPPVGIKFLMKRLKDDSIFTFITVLESIVWICILSAFFINSFILWASERFSPYSYRNNKQKYADDDDTRDFTVKECLWFCMTSLTPQGGGTVPKHFSGRMVVITWWLFGFIILASYTANLAAFLTLSKLQNPIGSFDDLYRQFRMKYAPLNGSDEEAYFRRMAKAEETLFQHMGNKKNFDEYPKIKKYHRILRTILNSTLPTTVDEALDRVHQSQSTIEGFAFITDSVDARYLLLTRCNLIDVESEVGKRPFAIALPKYSLLKYDIDRAITIIQQNHWLEALDEKWWENNPLAADHCVELEDDDEGIGIFNMGGVFLIIFIGIGITGVTIAYDYRAYKRRVETPVTRMNVSVMFPDGEDNEMPQQKIHEIASASKLQHRNINKY